MKLPAKLSVALSSAELEVNNPAPVKVDTITNAMITPITNEATPKTSPVISPPVCPFLFI